MKRQLSLEEYRNIDLTLFAVMLAVFEFLIHKAATAWFPDELYMVSLAGPITAIVMMRWGPWSGLHAALAGLLFSLYSGGSARHYIIYIVGNLFSMLALLMYRKVGAERIRKSTYLSLAFALLVSLSMQAGRFAVSLAVGNGFSGSLAFITTDALSIFFTLVIVWIARKLDGIFENQKIYLLRVNSESEEGKGGTL